MKMITKSLTHIVLASTILMGCAMDMEDTKMQKENTAMAMEDAKMQKENTINDLEIAHTAYTAGAIDIRYAHLALALSENPEVRKFAELMVRDHTAVNKKALALVKKLNITPQDNAMSRQLNQQAQLIRTQLAQLRGQTFDRWYAANELEYHQTVNQAVETQFIPNAQNAELKALLVSALQTFKVHEGHAEVMNRKVM